MRIILCPSSQYGTVYTSQRAFIRSYSICVVVGDAALGLGVVLGGTFGNAIGYCYVNSR